MSTRSKVSKRWSALLAVGGVGVALVAAGCGGSSNAPASAGGGYGAVHAAPSATVAAKPATTQRASLTSTPQPTRR
jgi:hypothetical protein